LFSYFVGVAHCALPQASARPGCWMVMHSPWWGDVPKTRRDTQHPTATAFHHTAGLPASALHLVGDINISI